MDDPSFDAYWRNYLAGHSRLPTRLVHYLGLVVAPLIGVGLSFTFAWWAFFVVYPIGYFAALFTHPMFESNTNKEFASHAWWSVLALFRMLWLDLTGETSTELARLRQAR